MIRINLLCQADAGIIPFKWLDGYNRPFPDFSTPHKCRNYNAILDWATERQAPVPEGHVWTVQPGEKIFPRPAWMLSA